MCHSVACRCSAQVGHFAYEEHHVAAGDVDMFEMDRRPEAESLQGCCYSDERLEDRSAESYVGVVPCSRPMRLIQVRAGLEDCPGVGEDGWSEEGRSIRAMYVAWDFLMNSTRGFVVASEVSQLLLSSCKVWCIRVLLVVRWLKRESSRQSRFHGAAERFRVI